MKKQISLITPYRKRIKKLNNLIASINLKSYNIDHVELILAIDSDDKESMGYIDGLLKTETLRYISYIIRNKNDHFIKEYTNPLALKAAGRWIIPVNDDAEIITQNWDVNIIETMGNRALKEGDDIILGLTNDGIVRTGEDPEYPHFACFPVLSKEHVDALGYLFNEMFWIWGADHFVADVYRRLGRLVSLTDSVKIEHASHHSQKREKTPEEKENFDRICAIETKHGFSIQPEMVENEANKLISYLKEKHGSTYEVEKGPLTIF